MKEETKVILDVDPGHDDAVAILLAAASESLDLRGITVVAGNQTLPKTTLNARRICTAAGITDVGIYEGTGSPLVRDQVTGEFIHGGSGLDGPEFSPPYVEVRDKGAVDFMLDELVEADDGITIAAVGPLTNVALALIREPQVKANVDEIVVMGGSMGIGNYTAAAEFNIFADPEAAHVVFETGVPVTMVGLDVTRQAEITPPVMKRLREIGNRVTDLTLEMLDYYWSTYKRAFDLDNPPLHDPCVVAYLIDREVITTKAMRVDVDLNSGIDYGRTVCDYYGRSGREVNAKVGIELSSELFWEILLSNLEKY